MQNRIIASWNVNSLKARHEHVLAWLETNRVDILCLQETKLSNESFDSYAEIYRQMGYFTYHNGIGQYNGVAILSRVEPVKVRAGFNSEEPNIGVDYEECRLLVGYFEDFIVYNVYVPNGRALQDRHMEFKLKWLSRLKNELQGDITNYGEKTLIICGDFNIAPVDNDVKNIELMEESTHVSKQERKALFEIEDLGFVDIGLAYMNSALVDSKFRFTWWDYRQLAFQKNDGMRIDLFLVRSPEFNKDPEKLTKMVLSYRHYRDERKKSKPSDHIPISISVSN